MSKETKTPATLDECQTLGQICDYIKTAYDAAQPMSSTGKSLLKGYLKNAKPASDGKP